MNPLGRAALGVGLAGVVACGPLIGLDGLRSRSSAAETNDEVDADKSECTTNKECIERFDNQPALCVEHKCSSVDTSLCLAQVLPSNNSLLDDNVVLVAAFDEINGEVSRSPQRYAYTLALEELDAVNGIPRGDNKRSPLAMLLCASEPELVQQSVTHVVNDLRVPAIVANFSEGDMMRLLSNVLLADTNKVFTINPNVTAEGLKRADVERLVWNLLGTPEDVALAYRPLLHRVETKLLANGRTAPIRVALLDTDASIESGMSTVIRLGPINHELEGGGRLLEKAISFNGKSVEGNDNNFLRIPMESIENNASPNYAEVRSKLLAFEPDVIIALTTIELSEIVKSTEELLATAGKPLPYWILGPRNAREALAYINASNFEPAADKRKRFLGVQYAGASDREQHKQWLNRMDARYSKGTSSASRSDYEASENFYDAVYWLAYGLAAAGPSAPTTGESFAYGVRRLVDGSFTIHPGPSDAITNAFRSIGNGKTTFVGALGPPDIDLAFGTWNSVGAAYCYGLLNDETPSTAQYVPTYDVLRFDRQSGELVEAEDIAARCFIGF